MIRLRQVTKHYETPAVWTPRDSSMSPRAVSSTHALVVSALGSYLPARRAARLTVREALTHV